MNPVTKQPTGFHRLPNQVPGCSEGCLLESEKLSAIPPGSPTMEVITGNPRPTGIPATSPTSSAACCMTIESLRSWVE